MRSLSAAELAVLATPDYQVYARLRVENATLDELFGIDNEVLRSFNLVADLDTPVQTATVVLDLANYPGLSPYLSSGYQLRGVPLFAEDRAVSLEIRVVPQGTAPDDFNGWRTVFRGGMDTAAVDPVADTVTLHCRDRIAALQSTGIENLTDNTANGGGLYEWGFPVTGGLVDDMLRAVLDTAFQYAYGGPYPEDLVIQDAMGTTATDYWQERTNLLDALRALGVGKDGRDLRGRWDGPNGLDSFELTYYMPDRLGAVPVGVPLTRINKSHDGVNLRYLQITGLNFDITGIRNVAEVTPADDARVPVVTENATSIGRFARRFLAVSEDATTHIDSPAEASTLGGIIVSDLGTGKSDIALLLPFVWLFEINDVFQVGSDGRVFDREDLIFSVTRLELSYALGAGTLTVNGSQIGASQTVGWRLASQAYKARATYASLTDAAGPARERAVWLQYDE